MFVIDQTSIVAEITNLESILKYERFNGSAL